MKKCICYFYLFFAACMCGMSCSHSGSTDENPNSFIGRKLYFSKQGQEIIDSVLKASDYMLVSYVDSSSCTPCAMQKYRYIQAHHKDLEGIGISTMFVFFGKPRPDILDFLKMQRNTFPTTWDTEQSFKTDNRLLSDPVFHDFIIDKTGEIIWISNPFLNEKSWEYCRQAVVKHKNIRALEQQ